MSGNGLARGLESLREPDSALLKSVLDSIPGRVSIVDTEHRYLYANRELLDFLGRPAAEIVGKKVGDILGDGALAAFAPAFERVLTGQVAKFEGWVTYFGDQRRYVKQVLTPYRSGEGRVEGFFFVGRDQTEWRERELELERRAEALRISEATRAAVVLSALDCIVVFDGAGTILEFNPAAESTFGYSRAFALGRPIADLVLPAEAHAGHEARLRHFLTRHQTAVLGRRIETEAMRADRSTFPAEFSVTEMQLTGGHVFAAHVRDLTDAKAAQAEIEHQRERLHQAERLAAMGSLLASVAHELNNPLAIVVAQSTLLNLKAEAGPSKQRAQHIHAAAQRCARIVKSFLAMARQRPPERKAVDLNTIIGGALEISEYGRRSAGIQVDVALDERLALFEGDPDLLSQVVTNLLLNAGQAVRDHGEPRNIWVSTRGQNGHLALTVADNGPGVPAGLRARIFEPYFTTKPSGVGTGIGLSISKSIVEAHGGRIEVRDREGGGAVFEVLFPTSAVVAAPVKAAEPAGPAAYQVLIVDDEPDVGLARAEVLGDLGHEAVIECDPLQALNRIGVERFDLVFADFRMPGLNGLDLRQRIAGIDPGLAARTVIVTGDTFTGPDAIAGQTGSTEPIVLEKPFMHADVDAALRRAEEFPPKR